MRDLVRHQRRWTEAVALQHRFDRLVSVCVADDGLTEQFNGIATALRQAMSWLGTVQDHHRPETEELILFEAVELTMQVVARRLDDVEHTVTGSLKKNKTCPMCGKVMRWVPCTAYFASSSPQFEQHQQWACGCGENEKILN